MTGGMSSSAAVMPFSVYAEPTDVIPFNARAVWPRSVPSVWEAQRVLFEGSGVPAALRGPSMGFLARVSPDARDLFRLDPRLPGVAAFKGALVAAWRLELALALPMGAQQDEEALQAIFLGAAEARGEVRAALASGIELRELVAALEETEGHLLRAWDKLMRRTSTQATPPGGYRALGQRGPTPARQRTGKSGLHPAPTPSPATPVSGSPRTRALTCGLMVVLAALTVGWSVTKDGEAFESGGAPEGWVLAGDLDQGLATLLPANPEAPRADAELTVWLGDLEHKGFVVQTRAPHEFTLTRQNLTPQHRPTGDTP